MNKLIFIILIFLLLISCSKANEGKKVATTDLTQIEPCQALTEQDKPIILINTGNGIELPEMEISRENIFAEFPENPDFFVEKKISVTIKRIDNRSSQFPTYFGIEPVYVTGENFEIIFASDNGYEIRLVTLKGKSIFSYWDQYFDATWDDVKKSWGVPYAGSRCYYDNTEWYYVDFFTIDEKTGKIKEIKIGKSL